MVKIRPITGEERRTLTRELFSLAFWPTPPLQPRENIDRLFDDMEDTITLATFAADGSPAATATYTEMQLNLRGHLVPASGLWGVATAPEHRRKGHAKAALHALLQESRTKHAYSVLYPFRESFYERLGYVSYPQPRIAYLKPHPPVYRIKVPGTVHRLLGDEAGARFYPFLTAWSGQRHGAAFFDEWVTNRRFFGERANWLAAAEINGEVRGVLVYRIKDDQMTCSSVLYDSPEALYLLLQYVTNHADQIDEARWYLPPDAFPQTWISDLPIRFGGSTDAGMGRVLDVSRMGGIPVGPGAFTAHIHDDFITENEGVYRFSAEEGALHVEPADNAEFELTIQGLSALVFGTHDPRVIVLHGWGTPDDSQQAALRVMFPAVVPFMHQKF